MSGYLGNDPTQTQQPGWLSMFKPNPMYAPGFDPLTAGIMGMAGAFGQGGEASRLPVSFGGTLGKAAAAMGGGINAANQAAGTYQDTQGRMLQNQLAQAQLPVAQARAKFQTEALNNPQLLQQMFGMNLPGGGAGGAAPPPGTGLAPTTLPPGGAPTSLPAGGAAAAAGGTQNSAYTAAQNALATIPDETTRQQVVHALVANKTPMEAWPTFVAIGHGESNWNPKVGDNKTNKDGTIDIGPAMVNSKHIGEGGLTEAQLRDPQTNINKGVQIFNQAWTAAGGDPTHAMAAYNTGQPTGAPPSYTPKALNSINEWTGGLSTATGPQPIMSPRDAMALGQRLYGQSMLAGLTGIGDQSEMAKAANMMLEYGLAPSKAGSIAGATKAAEQPYVLQNALNQAQLDIGKSATQAQIDIAKAGPEAREKSRYQQLDAKPGSFIRYTGGDGQEHTYQVPVETEQQAPGGQVVHGFSTAPVPGSPPGAPGTFSPSINVAPPGTPGTSGAAPGVPAGVPGTPGGTPGTPGTPQFGAAAPGSPVVAKLSPVNEDFLKEYGKGLGESFDENNKQANAAMQNNFLFDNLRRDSQSWQQGKFADIEGSARNWLSAAGHTFGLTPENSPVMKSLDQKLGDYQAFVKSAGSLLRTAVHETSPRASTQEYNMIEHTLPQPTTSAQAFSQIADQWQGLNDYKIAKQTMQHEYLTHPQDFDTDFNKNVSPHVFMLNRMMQSDQGKQDLQRMLDTMRQTKEGQATATGLLNGYQYAQQHGLFNGLPARPVQQ